MTKRVFFSFDYDDVKSFRANVVRNHGLLKETGSSGFFDSSIWETAKTTGVTAIKNLINRNLENTSVTCVLIGTNTWKSRWVRYEILRSYERGNTLLGIHINSVRDKDQKIFLLGSDPFDFLGFFIDAQGNLNNYQEHDGIKWITYTDFYPEKRNFDRQYWNNGYKLSNWVKCYDWVAGDGFNNFSSWINS